MSKAILRLAAAGSLSLALAAPAAADPVVVHDGFTLAGPVLAGDQVVWAQSNRRGDTRVRAALPGGQAATLAQLGRLAPVTDFGRGLSELAASADTLAVSTNKARLGRKKTLRIPRAPVKHHRRRFDRVPVQLPKAFLYTVLSGRLGQPLAELARTTTRVDGKGDCTSEVALNGLAVVGTRVIRGQIVTPCQNGRPRFGQSSATVLAQDTAGSAPAAPILTVPATGFVQIKAEGDYVAIALGGAKDFNGTTVVVLQLSTGQEVFRQSIGELSTFDIQADGTLAYLALNQSKRAFFGTPTLVSAANPVPRSLPVRAEPSGGIAISNGRLAFGTQANRSTKLTVTDLNGAPVAIGGQGARLGFSETGALFDLGPTRVTWLEESGVRILAEDLP